jgi:hypothetical protein
MSVNTPTNVRNASFLDGKASSLVFFHVFTLPSSDDDVVVVTSTNLLFLVKLSTMDDMLFMTFLWYYYAHEQQRKNALAEDARRRRRYRHFCSNLSAERKHRRHRRIPRASLRIPWDLPWQMTLGSVNEQSLITLTGFDCKSFNLLHGLFLPLFNRFTPHSSQQNGSLAVLQRQISEEVVSRGRKRIITSEACLALLLVFIRTTVPNFMLSVLFGLMGTAVKKNNKILSSFLTLQRAALSPLGEPRQP